MSRSLGDFSFKNNNQLGVLDQMVIPFPDVRKIQRKLASFVFMGSDGVWERKTSAEMVKWIRKKCAKT